jgi:hypothetical protein
MGKKSERHEIGIFVILSGANTALEQSRIRDRHPRRNVPIILSRDGCDQVRQAIGQAARDGLVTSPM